MLLDNFIQGKMGYLSAIDQENEKKVLIVDDDPDVRKILAEILSVNDYRTEVASDGLDAGIKIVQFKPDLIILDLFMPNMDGFEVCKRIKGDSDHSHIKILILTGYDTKENKDRTLKAGADGYLSKPVNTDDLINHIQNLFSLDEKQSLHSTKEEMVND